jgi:hypothetical protein
MKDANGKGVQAGRYLIVVIDTGFGSSSDASGVAPGSWQSRIVDIGGDTQFSIQLTPY